MVPWQCWSEAGLDDLKVVFQPKESLVLKGYLLQAMKLLISTYNLPLPMPLVIGTACTLATRPHLFPEPPPGSVLQMQNPADRALSICLVLCHLSLPRAPAPGSQPPGLALSPNFYPAIFPALTRKNQPSALCRSLVSLATSFPKPLSCLANPQPQLLAPRAGRQ